MRPLFHPRLVNDPFGDPGVYINFLFDKRALMMDLGEISPLSSREMLKIGHVFVSHTHMDHFIGFDRLLRLCLGRNKELYFYGPPGFLKNVEGKLAGYSWNLVAQYTNRFMLHAVEIHPDRMFAKTYPCKDGFLSEKPPSIRPFGGVVHGEDSWSVHAAVLEHGIPVIGYALKERFHVNILKERLDEMNLSVGPWLRDFKNELYKNKDPNSEFVIPADVSGGKEKIITLEKLSQKIATITPGQKIAYITDISFSEENESRVIDLAKGANQLFIEAYFLEKDKELAREKRHLTAWQAGMIAARANVRQYCLFHFSPRYTGMEDQLRNEAENGFKAYCDN